MHEVPEGFEVVASGMIAVDFGPDAEDPEVQIMTAIASIVDQLKAAGVLPPDHDSDGDSGPPLQVIAI